MRAVDGQWHSRIVLSQSCLCIHCRMTGILTGNLLEIVFDAFALLLVDLGLQSLGAPLLLVCRVLGQSSLQSQSPTLANPISTVLSHPLLDRVSLRDGNKDTTYQGGSTGLACRVSLVPRCAAAWTPTVGADDARLGRVRLLAPCLAGDRRLLLRRRRRVEGSAGALKVFRLLLAANVSHCGINVWLSTTTGWEDGLG